MSWPSGSSSPLASGRNGYVDLRRLVQAELCAVLGRELSRAGDVIGVDVRVDHIAQREPALAQQRLVLRGVDRRIDDRGFV